MVLFRREYSIKSRLCSFFSRPYKCCRKKKQLIVVSFPGKNMLSVRGAASPTPCYNTHTQIMNNAHHNNGGAALDDLCRVWGCKLHRGIKAKGRVVKPEPPYSCISYADKFLVAFNINILVDTPEIHPQMFCTLCLIKAHVFLGQKS